MIIKLLHRYQSAATNEEPLQSGDHELDDSLAQYLVDNGHAIVIESEAVVQYEEAPLAAPKRRRRKKTT